MSRPDLTDSVIHFIKAASEDEACEILVQIIREGVLRGGSGFIKGKYLCVCFAELSLPLIKHGFVNAAGNTRYTRLGVMVPKEWLFAHGGRPVIYQTEEEFALLPESLRWKHVAFNLGSNPIDFTWEREWRIQCECLRLDPDIATLIVPSQSMAERLRSEYEHKEHYDVLQYSLIIGDVAEGFWRPFEWNVRVVPKTSQASRNAPLNNPYIR